MFPTPDSPFRLCLDIAGNVVVGAVWLGLLIASAYLAGDVLQEWRSDLAVAPRMEKQELKSTVPAVDGTSEALPRARMSR